MEKLSVGEIATLEDGKEYIVFSQIVHNNNDYVYLMSNFKPLDIRFAKQIMENDSLKLEIVSDSEEKQKLFELFKSQTF